MYTIEMSRWGEPPDHLPALQTPSPVRASWVQGTGPYLVYLRSEAEEHSGIYCATGGQGTGGNRGQPRHLSVEIQDHPGVPGAGLECAALRR